MILIFDLDDTLYDEMTFVDSGLAAVARYGAETWGWDYDSSLSYLREALRREGRGRVFDLWLEEWGHCSKRRVAECVKVYRHHSPRLGLFPAAQRVLDRYKGQVPLYIVTDGHKQIGRAHV